MECTASEICTKRPTIAIVGRPNVGKSALFNALCKKRISIVDEAEGVTRDRIYAESELFGMFFKLVDTGGLDLRTGADFQEEINRQVHIAVEEADVIIMVVDSRTGLSQYDEDLAKMLHRTQKPLCLAVNKMDNLRDESILYNFYGLGIQKILPVSATQGHNLAELLAAALEQVDLVSEEAVGASPLCNVALVGRPNVGKSSLLNTLLNDQRSIVSPIPGTTRDSIDAKVSYGEEEYLFIDTAGIRRKKSEHDVIDKFSKIRTDEAIERADVCLLMIDATQGLTSQEKKIANQVEEAGKGCIILLNKWDLVKGFRMEHCLKEIHNENPFLKHCPVICISAKEGRNLDKIFPLINTVFRSGRERITTHALNVFVEKAMQRTPPPMIQGKRLRIYYMTQVTVEPPAFILFTNYPNLMTEAYKRYLMNQFREQFSFAGVPLRFYLRGKQKRDHD